MKKVLLLILGYTTLILGITGIVLPVLPTTPFLLVSAACFMRSSQRLYDWLLNHKVLGIYIRSYLKYKAISKKAKILSISTIWIFISISVYIVSYSWLKILLILIAISVTLYLWKFRTLTREMLEEYESRN